MLVHPRIDVPDELPCIGYCLSAAHLRHGVSFEFLVLLLHSQLLEIPPGCSPSIPMNIRRDARGIHGGQSRYSSSTPLNRARTTKEKETEGA